jgi:UDP-glucose 4-epimerase
LLLASKQAEGEIVNIGSPHEITILELAERVRSSAGSSSPIVRVPYAQAYPEGGFEDMRRRVPCVCKITRLTGWAPHTTIDEMIAYTIGHERRLLSRPPAAALTVLPQPELTI